MRGYQPLLDYEDCWVTDMGAFVVGERVVFRGKDLFHDLKDLNWMGLLLYGITGRLLTENRVKLFEGFWALSTSYPDPRLWNNRVAALAGTTRSTAALAIGAATAVSEAVIYGNRVNMRSIDFFLRTKTRLDQGANLTELVNAEMKQYRGIGGYGRPLSRRDERIEPVMALAKELGLADGPHIKIAFAVEEILLKARWRLYMNITAVQAALAADLGFSRHEYHRYMILAFCAGMFPGYIDTSAKPEGAFFPLRCDKIQYEGKSPRRVWKNPTL